MNKKKQPSTTDQNGVFFLKIMLYLLVGTLWLKTTYGTTVSFSIPIGLIIALPFAAHEHFQIDKKIEYAVLLVAMLIGYFAPFGLYIAF